MKYGRKILLREINDYHNTESWNSFHSMLFSLKVYLQVWTN
jgi:hypothetical protein